MGNWSSNDAPTLATDLAKFKAFVLFTDNEILKLYRRFQSLGGSLDVPISGDVFIALSEIKNNPFKYRFCRVFGEFNTNTDDIANNNTNPSSNIKITREQLLKSSQDITNIVVTFDSFLKFLSSCSYRSDLTTKTRLAFSLYDFDQDGNISVLDIECLLVLALGQTQLHTAQYKQIAHEVMSEVDIDGNGSLTELEFSRVLSRLHDFESRLTLDVEYS